ncbi:hypothetical protein DBR06_SOUSAS510001, partial [Sousa chinensis]
SLDLVECVLNVLCSFVVFLRVLFHRVDVLSAGPIVPPPQECLPSERTQTTETAVLMDAQADCEVETKKAIT